MSKAALITATLAVGLLAACESMPPSKENVARVGRSMEQNDQMKTTHALERSRDGESTTWRNNATGLRYSVTPTRTYEGEAGARCRDFTTAAQMDGRDEVVHGTACKQADGA
jgi:surface antigen